MEHRHSQSIQLLIDSFSHRELLGLFFQREVTLRYRHTILNILWIVLRPLIMTAAFFVIFGKYGDGGGKIAHYPLFVLLGVVCWQLLSNLLLHSTSMLRDQRPLITKNYFPRLLIPLNACLLQLLDFCVNLGVITALCFYFQIPFGASLLWLPLIALWIFCTGLAITLWVSVISIWFHDLVIVVPFTIQMGLFVCPVIYPTQWVSPTLQWIYALNPAVGIIEAMRLCVLGGQPDLGPLGGTIAISLASSLLLLLSGIRFFARYEPDLAELL